MVRSLLKMSMPILDVTHTRRALVAFTDRRTSVERRLKLQAVSPLLFQRRGRVIDSSGSLKAPTVLHLSPCARPQVSSRLELLTLVPVIF